MKLSVLIPVYNEEAGLEELLQRVTAVPVDKEIIVVDDCSSDGTAAILQTANLPELRVISHAINRGKGAAIRTALEAAAGDAILIQDADLEYDPADYPALLAPIEAGQCQVVYGVRDLAAQRLLFQMGNRFLTALTNLIYGSHLADMETCYKVMTIAVARTLNLECNRFDLEPEITAKVLRQDYAIHQVPISYHPRTAKKLSPWRDGLPALQALWRYRRWQPQPTTSRSLTAAEGE